MDNSCCEYVPDQRLLSRIVDMVASELTDKTMIVLGKLYPYH